MITRTLGKTDRTLNAIGLGCMGLSEFYGPPTEQAQAIALLRAAVENGVNHFDTAEMYGMGANEALLGEAFADRRDKVFIATKFGPTRDPETGAPSGVDGTPANCRRAIEQSLRLLKTDHIDLYYLHRKDPKTPIEETVGAMAELVREGKVGALGLSEVGGETLRRAHAVHPISAVQSEYSIFTRDVETSVIPACLDLGVTLVAYSPLGRGMLTGGFKANADAKDFRGAYLPRFQGEALEANLALVGEIDAVATAHGATPSQIALAWVLARGDHVMTIPGTTKLANLESNLGAAGVTLSPDARARLDGLADRVQGARYHEQGMLSVDA